MTISNDELLKVLAREPRTKLKVEMKGIKYQLHVEGKRSYEIDAFQASALFDTQMGSRSPR